MSTAHRAARKPWVGWLGRIGFAAQGTCFLIIGVLALELAFGDSGRLTDPRGAFVVLAQGGWTRALLVLLAIGFACYSIWRLAQAIFDRGGMGSNLGGLGRRAIQLGQSVLYALLTVSAVRVLLGARASGSPKRAAAGILGWPGGTAIVAALGVVSWFMVKAAVDYNAGKVVSLGGAMSHLARAAYGSWLLTAIAAGLIAYGVFGLLQARYHRV